jgi:hypothetical protein
VVLADIDDFAGFGDLAGWVFLDVVAGLGVLTVVSRVWMVLVVIFVFSAHFVKLFERKLVVFGRVDFFPAQVFVKQFFFRKFGHKNIIA